MKINKIYSLFILFSFFSFSWISAQGQWIDVRGQSDEVIKKIIYNKIDERKKKGLLKKNVFEGIVKKYNDENASTEKLFNQNDEKYLEASLYYTGVANDATSDRLISIGNLHDIMTKVENANLNIANQDTAIQSEKFEIQKKKNETFKEIGSVGWYTVALTIVEENDGEISKNDLDFMDYEVARKAADQKLGSEVININIVENGILTEEIVEIKLQGRVNTVESKTLSITRSITKDMETTDKVQLRLISVNPYDPEKNTKLLRQPNRRRGKKPKPKTFVGDTKIYEYLEGDFAKKRLNVDGSENEFAIIYYDGIISEMDKLYSKAEKNYKQSKNKIQRIGKSAKNFIDKRQESIKKAKDLKKLYNEQLEDYMPELTEALQDSTRKTIAESKALKEGDLWRQASILYRQREERIKTFQILYYDKDLGGSFLEDEIYGRYNDFLKLTNSTIIKEKRKVSRNKMEEEKLANKTSAVVVAYKLLGNYSQPERLSDGTVQKKNGTAFAIKYGFNFDKTSTLKKLPPPPDLFAEDESSKSDDTYTDNNEANSLESEMDAIRQQAMAAANMPAKTPAKKTPKVTVSKKANNIRFTSSPRADVYISGKKIGKTPLDYYLDPSGPHGIVLKKRGYKELSDVVSVSATTKVTKDYEMNKDDQEVKSAGFPRWVIYAAVLGGGAAVALGGSKKDAPKTGSLSVTINVPN